MQTDGAMETEGDAAARLAEDPQRPQQQDCLVFSIEEPRNWQRCGRVDKMCPICAQVIKCGGGSVTNCMQHIARRHKTAQFKTERSNNALTAARNRLSKEEHKPAQKVKSVSVHQQQVLDKAFLDFLMKSRLSLADTAKAHSKEWATKLQDVTGSTLRWEPPSRYMLRKQLCVVMDEKLQSLRRKIEGQAPENVVVCHDGWTDGYQRHWLMALVQMEGTWQVLGCRLTTESTTTSFET